MTPERISNAESFCVELHGLTNEIEMLETMKNRAASTCFVIAQDHHAAMVLLMKNTFYSSSFALLRSIFEAYLRGLWLKHCATEAQANEFFQGTEPPKTMVAEIEETPDFSDSVLSRIKRKNWNTMCEFTHTGGLHLQRWQSHDAVEPKFDEEELEECLNCAELFGAMAGLELVQLKKSGDTGARVLELIKKRWP
jgi:hypothetical protein